MSSSSQMFLDSPREDAIRVDIQADSIRKGDLGAFEYANNVFSLLTLGIIPWRSGDKASQDFNVKSEGGESQFSVTAGYIQNAGHLPLPAFGVTDILLFAGGTVIGCVCSLATMDITCMLFGMAFPLLNEDRPKDANTTKEYMEKELDYAKLAKMIASSLKQSDYNAAMRKRKERIKFLPASVVAGYAEMDAKIPRLRHFALKKMPSLWKRVQSLRAALDVQEEKVVQARERLSRVGRTPEQDSGYIRLCEERHRMAILVRNLFDEIEEAYLDAAIYEDSLGDRGLKKFEKEQQEGVDDARMLRKQYERYK